MGLRIAIDVRRIADFGIGTYIRNLLRGISALDRENRYLLVCGTEKPPMARELGKNFECAPYTPPRHKAAERFVYPLFLRALDADLYHIPLNAVPLGMPRPYVVTIHDVSSLIFRHEAGRVRGMRLWRLRRGLQRAERVIAVSAATRRDVMDMLRVVPERIRVIHNAPDPVFRPSPVPAIACVDEKPRLHYPAGMRRILDRYQIDSPFVLYAGTVRPQKNIPRLVEAFSVARTELERHPLYRGIKLIIIGDEISKSQAIRRAVIQSGVEAAVRFLGFVPLETLRVFYQAASAFVFPSLYEGFGLPPLEAMACGTPVVCSEMSSLPEVIGDAAVIVNPENVFDIARGIREALVDQGLRAEMVARGLEQAGKFSWERTAAQVLETYREAAGQGR